MKNFLFFLPVFIWLQACSQSPAPDATAKQPGSILTDSSGVVLGDSPDKAYRLFKFARQVGDHTETDLKLLRLKDLQETVVSTLTPDALTLEGPTAVAKQPKFYWAKDARYLIVENSVPDSTFKVEVVLFDLNNFNVAHRKQGNLLAYDPMNNIAFMYRYTAERQLIYYFDLKFSEQERVREIITPPSGKLPVIILSPTEKRAKVKAYMADGVPVNVAFLY